jgi:hypothetical protein
LTLLLERKYKRIVEKAQEAVIATPPLAGEAIHLLYTDCFVTSFLAMTIKGFFKMP